MITRVLVLGGGTAGLISAIAIKRRNPEVHVKVIRSEEIPHIMVGEGSVGSTPGFLHDHLGLPRATFYRDVNPTWKLGVRFLWGPRPYFDYTFSSQYQGRPLPDITKPLGYYCLDRRAVENISYVSTLMSLNRVFPLGPEGLPIIKDYAAYHFENARLVAYLEKHATRNGIAIESRTVRKAGQDANGITSLLLQCGSRESADLYVDCSGFRGVLIHQTLGEPYESFSSNGLLCNRALVGGWERRSDEPIRPFTTAETMDAGWCWQIEHERLVNRGYVYCSDFISDDDAEREFRDKNPTATETRIVPFESRRVRRAWVKNVVAVGNACGFVEPLEATNIQVIASAASSLAALVNLANRRPGAAFVNIHNVKNRRVWETVRDFLALHYRFNTRLDTPFWRTVRNDTRLGRLESLVDFYTATGPNSMAAPEYLTRADMFGMEGYLAMLVGMQVPYEAQHRPTEKELAAIRRFRQANFVQATKAVTSEDALAAVRSPKWSWSSYGEKNRVGPPFSHTAIRNVIER